MESQEGGEERPPPAMVKLGSYGGEVMLVVQGEESAAEETMLLWGIQQPTLSKPNAFVSHSSLQLCLDSCGHSLSILQSPSSLGTPGVTGAVMWDSGVVLGKFLEHSVDSGLLVLQGKKIVELGSGCGLVGCIAALLGGEVVLTDLPDRLRLLRKNIETNMKHVSLRGSITATELTWGEDPDPELIKPTPDYILGSDVVYSERAVVDLLETLGQLSGPNTTIFLAGELRNDAILEYFLEAAMNDFTIGRVDQTHWHPDYRSNRVVLYVLGTPGVTGAVMWDSGVVLGKFLEHSVDSGLLVLQGKKIVELGSVCGLVGCIAALLGGGVVLTDLPDRLRLLRKNIETNMKHVSLRGSITATELTWGEDPDPELIKPTPDYILGSDVVYSERAVVDLLETLGQLSGPNTTIFLAGELRNDAILEYFLEAAMNDFTIGRVDQTFWHPDYRSNRVVLYVLVKK